jgi:hypothetical protein
MEDASGIPLETTPEMVGEPLPEYPQDESTPLLFTKSSPSSSTTSQSLMVDIDPETLPAILASNTVGDLRTELESVRDILCTNAAVFFMHKISMEIPLANIPQIFTKDLVRVSQGIIYP